MFPFFEIPLEVASSRRLTAVEKLTVASLRSWLYRQEPAEFSVIADRVGLDLPEFLDALRSLREKGVVSYRADPEGFDLLDPTWLGEDARRFLCGPLTVEDPDGDLAEGGVG